MKSLIVAAFAALFAMPAWSQGRNCAPHAVVLERLANGYSEGRVSVGLGANGSLIETFANKATGTWTITVTSPSGLTCLVASGQSFETLNEDLIEGEEM